MDIISGTHESSSDKENDIESHLNGFIIEKAPSIDGDDVQITNPDSVPPGPVSPDPVQPEIVRSSCKRTCELCWKAFEMCEESFSWGTLNFCDKICLAQYQNRIIGGCFQCKIAILSESAVGQLVYRFGSQAMQFCSAQCLNNFKRTFRSCCCCALSIRKAKLVRNSFGADLCSTQCATSYECVVNPDRHRKISNCGVCGNLKLIEVIAVINKASLMFCSNPCFAAYKFVNSVDPKLCQMCANYFLQNPSEKTFTIHHGEDSTDLCSQTCLNVYTMKTRVIMSCLICNITIFDYNMLMTNYGKIQVCSLRCYMRFQILQGSQDVVNTLVPCKHCHCIVAPECRVKVSNGSDLEFCTSTCAVLFFKDTRNVSSYSIQPGTSNLSVQHVTSRVSVQPVASRVSVQHVTSRLSVQPVASWVQPVASRASLPTSTSWVQPVTSSLSIQPVTLSQSLQVTTSSPSLQPVEALTVKPKAYLKSTPSVEKTEIDKLIDSFREYFLSQNLEHIFQTPSAIGAGYESSYMLESNEVVTVFHVVLASGMHIRPQIIVKNSLLKKPNESLKHTKCVEIKTGCQTPEIFFNYITTYFVEELDNSGVIRTAKHPFVLVLNSNVTKVSQKLYDWCKARHIIIVVMVPNVFQEVDRIVFQAAKIECRKAVSQLVLVPNETLNHSIFDAILKRSLTGTSDDIRKAFQDSGIFKPMNIYNHMAGTLMKSWFEEASAIEPTSTVAETVTSTIPEVESETSVVTVDEPEDIEQNSIHEIESHLSKLSKHYKAAQDDKKSEICAKLRQQMILLKKIVAAENIDKRVLRQRKLQAIDDVLQPKKAKRRS